jgi:hypothetical protein
MVEAGDVPPEPEIDDEPADRAPAVPSEVAARVARAKASPAQSLVG